MNQEKTCRINQENFKDTDLIEVRQLIDIFHTIYPNTIWVTKVWFLKKKEMKDGFELFHYDYDSSNGGHNAVSSTIVVNLGVFHSEDEEEEEEEEEEAGNADEEDEDDEDGQVEDGNKAMNEQGNGYLPAPPMEVEGVEENMDEGQIILLGKDIEEEEDEETNDKGEDEEVQRHHTSEESEDEASNNESVKEEGVIFAASNSPDQPERMMPSNKIQFLN